MENWPAGQLVQLPSVFEYSLPGLQKSVGDAVGGRDGDDVDGDAVGMADTVGDVVGNGEQEDAPGCENVPTGHAVQMVA